VRLKGCRVHVEAARAAVAANRAMATLFRRPRGEREARNKRGEKNHLFVAREALCASLSLSLSLSPLEYKRHE